jgi:predicted chitinase
MTVTLAQLKKIAPKGAAWLLADLIDPFNLYLPQYGIVSAPRLRHFLTQAAHETDGFTVLAEYASGKAYEGRKDLGNVNPGDGVKYKGRGIFMLTGRANYAAYGKKIGVDLVANPKLASSPTVSVRIACEYWKARGLNAWADRDDIVQITRIVNGGQNGLADRKAYYARAVAAIPLNTAKPPVEEIKPDAPIAAEAKPNPYTTPEAIVGYGTAGGTAVMGFGGVSGPLAYALAFAVVVGVLAVLYLFINKARKAA